VILGSQGCGGPRSHAELEKEGRRGGRAAARVRTPFPFRPSWIRFLAEFRGIRGRRYRSVQRRLAVGAPILDGAVWQRRKRWTPSIGRNILRKARAIPLTGIQRAALGGLRSVFLEVGPGPGALLGPWVDACCAAGEGLWMASFASRAADDSRQVPRRRPGELYASPESDISTGTVSTRGRVARHLCPRNPFPTAAAAGSRPAYRSPRPNRTSRVPRNSAVGPGRMPSGRWRRCSLFKSAAGGRDTPALLGEHRLYEKGSGAGPRVEVFHGRLGRGSCHLRVPRSCAELHIHRAHHSWPESGFRGHRSR